MGKQEQCNRMKKDKSPSGSVKDNLLIRETDRLEKSKYG